MRFQYAASALLLLSTNNASAFGTVQQPTSFLSQSQQLNHNNRKPFHIVSRGGGSVENNNDNNVIQTSSSCLKMSTSTEEKVTVDESIISKDNLDLLSERGRNALVSLIENDTDKSQEHVYGNWPPAGVDDDNKKKLTEQLANLNDSYPGGIVAYINKAKVLLKESAEGVNPFTDFTASVPDGELLSYEDAAGATMKFNDAEQAGIECIDEVAFVLVAGGLGERLGYSGIKLSLETNLCTNKSYLEVYIKYIQAMEHLAEIKLGKPVDTIKNPLVIMTSGDTDPLTRQLLKDNNNFGMSDDCISIVMQDKVPALKDINAGLALDDDDRWTIQTKPHGHGDVHHLLYKEGYVDKWIKEGKKWVVFLQDTNALVINSIVPTLGISKIKNFDMNSICIPRLAGEAAGAITRLEHKTDPEKSLTINVEYNQLDPLLRTQGDCKGDVPDETTGYSPYPGNANNIVIKLDTYDKTLKGEDQGVVVEFVNPKYKDGSKEFKKPTRLECMMQDIPKLFIKEIGGSNTNIGFTTFDRWFTFSPAKNALEAGVADVAKGSIAPGTMSSAESDKYISNQKKLKFAGVDIDVTDDPKQWISVGGIPVTPGPRIILCPGFAITQDEVKNKISGGKISKRSSLVLEGKNLSVKNLDLDGSLVVRADPDCHVTIDGLKVENKGWELSELPDDTSDLPETVRIRGYTMTKHETKEIIIKEPGKYHIGEDGTVNKIE